MYCSLMGFSLGSLGSSTTAGDPELNGRFDEDFHQTMFDWSRVTVWKVVCSESTAERDLQG